MVLKLWEHGPGAPQLRQGQRLKFTEATYLEKHPPPPTIRDASSSVDVQYSLLQDTSSAMRRAGQMLLWVTVMATT